MRVISIDASKCNTPILNLQVREILPELSVRLQLWAVQRGECWGAPLETCQVTSNLVLGVDDTSDYNYLQAQVGQQESSGLRRNKLTSMLLR